MSASGGLLTIPTFFDASSCRIQKYQSRAFAAQNRCSGAVDRTSTSDCHLILTGVPYIVLHVETSMWTFEVEVQRPLLVITTDDERRPGQQQQQRARPPDATLRVQTSPEAWSRTSHTTVHIWTLREHPLPRPSLRRRPTSQNCLPSTFARNATQSGVQSASPSRLLATTALTVCSTCPLPMCAPTKTGELIRPLMRS